MSLFYINLLCGFVWLGLSSDPSILSFIKGILLGFFLLILVERVFTSQAYTKRVFAFLSFLIAFIKAFIVSNISIAKAVLFRPTSKINPSILTYDTSHLSLFEVLMLAQCITLTPGTTTIDISDDLSEITIHAFDGENPDEIRKSIKNELEIPIVRFTS